MSRRRAAGAARPPREEVDMKNISQTTIRQFLRAAAVALALGNEAAQADSLAAMQTASPPPTRGNSSLTLAQDTDSGRELRITRRQWDKSSPESP